MSPHFWIHPKYLFRHTLLHAWICNQPTSFCKVLPLVCLLKVTTRFRRSTSLSCPGSSGWEISVKQSKGRKISTEICFESWLKHKSTGFLLNDVIRSQLWHWCQVKASLKLTNGLEILNISWNLTEPHSLTILAVIWDLIGVKLKLH